MASVVSVAAIGSGSAATITCDVETNAVGSWTAEAGDQLVAVQAVEFGTAAQMTPQTGSDPGWALLGQGDHGGGAAANGLHIKLWGLTSWDGEQTSFAFQRNSEADGTLMIVALRDVDLDSIDVAFDYTASGTAARTSPAVDGVSGGVLLAGASSDNNVTAWSESGITELAEARSGVFISSVAAGQILSADGSTGTRTFTGTGSGATAAVLAWALAIAPTGSGELPTAADVHGWGDPHPSSDDFRTYTGVPDPAKWNLYDSPGHAGNGVRSPDQVTVQDGYLRIHGLQDGTTGGMEHALDQQYGRWEIRARLHAAPGATGDAYHGVAIVWPTSNLWPDDGEYDFWENDVGDSTAQAFLHYPHPELPDNAVEQEEKIYEHPLDLTAWHHYAFEWTPEHVRGFIDGDEWFTFADDAGPNGRGPIQGMPSGHLTLQLDDFFGTPTLQEAYLDVEWVNVYTLAATETPTGAARTRGFLTLL